MSRLKKTEPFVLAESLLNAYATNDRINDYLIQNLNQEAWQRKAADGKGRNIAGIVAHMHNVRVMWLKAAAKGSALPEQLDAATVTKEQAVEALAQSREAITSLLAEAFAGDGRIKGFRPDVGSFLGYLISHDAHHRGHISMLARQLGYAIPQKAMFGMWEWGSR